MGLYSRPRWPGSPRRAGSLDLPLGLHRGDEVADVARHIGDGGLVHTRGSAGAVDAAGSALGGTPGRPAPPGCAGPAEPSRPAPSSPPGGPRSPDWPGSGRSSSRRARRRPPAASCSPGRSNSCRGSRLVVRATDMRTMSLAFRVASSFCLEWTQEQCSRMLAMSKKYWLMPPSRRVSRKSGSWVRGVQAATTTRLSPLSRMVFEICSAASVEQMNSPSSAWTTSPTSRRTPPGTGRRPPARCWRRSDRRRRPPALLLAHVALLG